MNRIEILGDGQIWDLKGVDPGRPEKIFEDLFCGRVLEEKARQNPRIFSRYIEKGKDRITGMSVTLALGDRKNPASSRAALKILNDMAVDAGRGIEALSRGTGFKSGWSRKDIALWKGISTVVIGGGVSRSGTGRILLKGIKAYLRKSGLPEIEVRQAQFPGKESGFLGAIAHILEPACSRFGDKNGRWGLIGVDLGRDKIGVGILMVNPKSCAIIGKSRPVCRFELRTARPRTRIKDFRKNRRKGIEIRNRIVAQIAGLVIKARSVAAKKGIECLPLIGLATPGKVSSDGYIDGGTDYLPFFTRSDGFHLPSAVEKNLQEKGAAGFRVRIINDGIAAGLANLRLGMDFQRLKPGKYAFLGPGSGLGGCLCRIRRK